MVIEYADQEETSPKRAPKYDFSNALRRYNPKKGYTPKPFIAADTETEGLGGRLIIGGYAKSDDPDAEITTFTTADEWLAEILNEKNEGYIWYVHNGGEYDFKYLIPALRAFQERVTTMTTRVIMSGQRIIGYKITFRKHTYELRDSYALMPESLENLTSILCPMFHKKDIGLKEGVIFDRHNTVHMDYFRTDILGLLHAVEAFRNIVWDIFGVPLGWTAPATAMMAWRHTLPAERFHWRQNRHAEAFFREAYYGGLVFLTDHEERENCTSVDFNSMYPSVMREYGVPTGSAIHTTYRDDQYAGIYQVRAHIPEDFPFTMIPHREGNTVTWPTGDFIAYASRHEMQFAEQYGAVFEVIHGYNFQQEEFIFTEFIDLCEEQRIAAKGTGIDKVVKIMQNGLYGKFGSRPVIQGFAIRQDDAGGEWTPHMAIDGSIVEGLYYKDDRLKAAYIQPHWAAWVTSHARVKMATAVMAIGVDKVYYGDTDSITADTEAIRSAHARGELEIGKKYGMLKEEHRYLTFWAGGPKNYQGRLDPEDNINAADIAKVRIKHPEMTEFFLDKAKGMPRIVIDPYQHREALAGSKVTVGYTGMVGGLTLLKHPKKPLTSEQKRSYSLLANSAGWRLAPNGKVRPVHRVQTDWSSVS